MSFHILSFLIEFDRKSDTSQFNEKIISTKTFVQNAKGLGDYLKKWFLDVYFNSSSITFEMFQMYICIKRVLNNLRTTSILEKTLKLSSDKIWILKWSFISIKWNLRSILRRKDKGWPQPSCLNNKRSSKWCLTLLKQIQLC